MGVSMMQKTSRAQLAETDKLRQKEIMKLTSKVEEMTHSRDELNLELSRIKEVHEAKVKELTSMLAQSDSELSQRMEQLIANNTNLTFQIGELTKRNMEVVALEAKASANARSIQQELSAMSLRIAEKV